MPDMAHHVLLAAREAGVAVDGEHSSTASPAASVPRALTISAAQKTQLQNMVTSLQNAGHPVLTLLRRRVFDELRRHFDASKPEEVVCKPNTGLDVVSNELHVLFTRAVRVVQQGVD